MVLFPEWRQGFLDGNGDAAWSLPNSFWTVALNLVKERRKDLKEVKEGIGSPHSPLYPSSSPLLRFPAVWPGNRSVKDYSFLKYPRGVRSEDRQVFPLWKFFSAPMTNIQSSLAAGCCRLPLYPQLIRCDSWPPACLCLCSASWGNHHISPRYHLSHCLNKYAAHLQIIKYSGRLWQNV